jgi:hypothetical protein
MKQTKEQIIAKISSFKYEELEEWMISRLHGEDKYFPINEGDETNLGRFLKDIHENIGNKKSRDNFLEILKDMVDELAGYCREEIIKEAEYIHELLSLCAGIKELENIDILYEIAVHGDLKGVKAFDMDLHQSLLSTLASFNLSGDYEFWLEQMKDDTNKYYTHVSFYSLLRHGYRPGIILKRFNLFIEGFKGEKELGRGIQALFDAYGEAEIIGGFNDMDLVFSLEQKEALNNALIEIGHDKCYDFSSTVAERFLKDNGERHECLHKI